MKLYHAAVSTCSQKVRLVLAEKGLEYESALLDLQRGDQFDAAYLALNPNAVVPTLENRGRALIESTLINEYLDDAYPEPALKPLDAAERHRMRLWTRRIDDALHPACGVVTYAIGVRPALLKRPREEVAALLAQIPDPQRRANRQAVIDEGVHAAVFAAACGAHAALFDDVDGHLTRHAWLAGSDYSLADAALTPYVVRVDHLGMGALLEQRPQLAAWYQRVQQRASFDPAVSAWLAQPLIDGFRASGAAVAAELDELLRR
ncbi:MAG: glutathione S-transferase family protein [Pseudomonadales bacterium]